MPRSMPTLSITSLRDRLVHVSVTRMHITHCGFHIRMSGDAVERERVHPLCPAGQARVTQDVKLERSNATGGKNRRMLFPKGGGFHVAALCCSREEPRIAARLRKSHVQKTPDPFGHTNSATRAFTLSSINPNGTIPDVLWRQSEAFFRTEATVE